jgi:thioredoxin-like negative regulator of GroEL
MKRSGIAIIIFTLAMLIIGLFSCSSKSGENNKSGNNLSNLHTKSFTFEDLKRELHTTDKQVVLINFWATWCGECRAEMPDLVEFYNEYKDRVLLIGLSLDESTDSIKKFMKLANVNFPVYPAGKKLVQHLMINAIPVTYLFKNGKYASYHMGRYSYSQLKSDVDSLLKK